MTQLRKSFIHALWLMPVLFFLETSLRRMAEPDLFFYYALVEHYLKTGVWSRTDPFVYTLPNDVLMTAHQWLGYWFYYLPYQAIGWAGPILLKTAIVAIFFLIPLIPYWRRRMAPPTYFVMFWTLAVYIAHHRFRERVSLFGDLFILLLISGLLWCREKRWFWYSLPPLFLVWTQLHPSWPLAWVILVAFFATQHPRHWDRRALICTGLCFLAPLLNPLGVEGYIYPFVFARDIEPYLRQYVVEWLPLTDNRLFEYRFLYLPFLTLGPFVAWRLWQQRRAAAWFEWMMWALALALTLKSVRFGLMAQGIFLLLIVNAELRQPLARTRGFAMAWVTWVTVLVSGTTIFYKEWVSNSWRVPFFDRFEVEATYFPIAAVDSLIAAKPHMHVFNSFGFGGYLAWRWQGDPPIYFHGFSTNFAFYEEFYNRPQYSRENLQKAIDKFDIGIFLLSKLGNDNAFIEILRQHPDWQNIREDQGSVIFAKRDPRVFH